MNTEQILIYHRPNPFFRRIWFENKTELFNFHWFINKPIRLLFFKYDFSTKVKGKNKDLIPSITKENGASVQKKHIFISDLKTNFSER